MAFKVCGKGGFLKLAADLIFPPRCPVCGEVVPIGDGICTECRDKLLRSLAGEKLCRVCGKPKKSCICREITPRFESCVSAFTYDDSTSAMMIELKNRSSQEVTAAIAEAMAAAFKRAGFSAGDFAFITEVPMNRQRAAQGRVNHAHQLALELSEILRITYCPPPIEQSIDYLPQHLLNRGERSQNAQKGYSAKEGIRLSGSALLIDDIVTTGATLERCTEILLQCGADRVVCLTAATTPLQ